MKVTNPDYEFKWRQMAELKEKKVITYLRVQLKEPKCGRLYHWVLEKLSHHLLCGNTVVTLQGGEWGDKRMVTIMLQLQLEPLTKKMNENWRKDPWKTFTHNPVQEYPHSTRNSLRQISTISNPRPKSHLKMTETLRFLFGVTGYNSQLIWWQLSDSSLLLKNSQHVFPKTNRNSLGCYNKGYRNYAWNSLNLIRNHTSNLSNRNKEITLFLLVWWMLN